MPELMKHDEFEIPGRSGLAVGAETTLFCKLGRVVQVNDDERVIGGLAYILSRKGHLVLVRIEMLRLEADLKEGWIADPEESEEE